MLAAPVAGAEILFRNLAARRQRNGVDKGPFSLAFVKLPSGSWRSIAGRKDRRRAIDMIAIESRIVAP
jgi:hypothetical protein